MGIATNHDLQTGIKLSDIMTIREAKSTKSSTKRVAINSAMLLVTATTSAVGIMNNTAVQAHADTVTTQQTSNVTKTVTPTATEETAATSTTAAKDYTVVSGDTLYSIAQKQGTTAQSLLDNNKTFSNNNSTDGLHLDTIIYPGDVIHITESATTENNDDPSIHVVTDGETIDSIASSHSLTVEQFKGLNNNIQSVKTGDKVKVTGTETTTVNNGTSDTTQQAQQTTTNTAQASNYDSNAIVQKAVQLANAGIPYVWGGESMSGMDCSGLTDYVYQQVTGKSLGHYTVTQESKVTKMAVSQAQPGDLLFWGSAGSTYHVGIYIGNGQFVAAPQPGQNVSIQSISQYFAPSFAGHVN